MSAKKKAADVPEALTVATPKEKWVLGYTSKGTLNGWWNIVFVPESKKGDIDELKPVREAKLYRVEEYTETRAIVAARKLLKMDLAEMAGGAA